jgi:hypothetical protein
MFEEIRKKTLIIGGALLLGAMCFGVQAQVQGGPVSICLALDGSGSLTSTEFDLQREGYALAVEDSAIVPRDGTVTFVVVQFSNVVVTEIAATTLNNETDAVNLAAAIRAITFQQGGATATGTAIETCVTELSGLSGRQVIDISTDGGSNLGTSPPVAADDAVSAGIDAINLIGVGQGVNVTELNDTARPQPASELPEPGFVVLVADFSDFNPAIESKIQAEIAGGGPIGPVAVPIMSGPALGMLVLILAVFGAGFIGWRRS